MSFPKEQGFSQTFDNFGVMKQLLLWYDPQISKPSL